MPPTQTGYNRIATKNTAQTDRRALEKESSSPAAGGRAYRRSRRNENTGCIAEGDHGAMRGQAIECCAGDPGPDWGLKIAYEDSILRGRSSATPSFTDGAI
jgi:hypothetical protein